MLIRILHVLTTACILMIINHKYVITKINCCRLNMSSDLMSLHIGDRILEVNGTPVKDQPVESIENLIQYSDTVLQVLYSYKI